MSLDREVLHRFQELLEKARASEIPEPDACSLATADARGRPSVRTVLLKECDERGFVFYTNRQSRKGRELAENPWAALCFFWQPLREQVTVEGPVETVADEEADAYWASRPRLSQLGAWASHQSEVLASREELQARLERYRREYHDRNVPRPPHWGGFRIVPEAVEFWSSREGRLHDRLRYQREGSGWRKILLNP